MSELPMSAEERLAALERKVNMMWNGGGDLLGTEGYLQIGNSNTSGAVRFDGKSVQIAADSATDLAAVRFLPNLSADPVNVYPKVTLGGRAQVSGSSAWGSLGAFSQDATGSLLVVRQSGTTGATRTAQAIVAADLPGQLEVGIHAEMIQNSSDVITAAYIRATGLLSPYYSFVAIASGAISVSSSVTFVAPESGTSDTLDTITPLVGSAVGVHPIMVLAPEGASDVITLSDAGNINLNSACVLTGTNQNITLIWNYLNSEWYEIARNNGSGSMTVKVKEADESLNTNATSQADNELLFSIAANAVVQFEGVLHISTPTAADFRMQFTGPTGATGSFSAIGNTDAGGLDGGSAGLASDVVLASADEVEVVRFWGGIHNGANAGSVTLLWAQGTSNGSNTTVRAGSYIKYQQANT